jgi:hypothetical protein
MRESTSSDTEQICVDAGEMALARTFLRTLQIAEDFQ